jgi:multidrug resistance efflux pump
VCRPDSKKRRAIFADVFPNVQPDAAGLATVNPIFTWVRLAQRVPVRIRVDQVPDGVRLVAGMTATVRIDLRPAPPSSMAGKSGAPSQHDRGNSSSGESIPVK